jgi:hypothetical protein
MAETKMNLRPVEDVVDTGMRQAAEEVNRQRGFAKPIIQQTPEAQIETTIKLLTDLKNLTANVRAAIDEHGQIQGEIDRSLSDVRSAFNALLGVGVPSKGDF